MDEQSPQAMSLESAIAGYFAKRAHVTHCDHPPPRCEDCGALATHQNHKTTGRFFCDDHLWMDDADLTELPEAPEVRRLQTIVPKVRR